MKFKIDENLPADVAELLRSAGWEADTVAQEGLNGAEDAILAEAVQRGRRILLTLDLDFSNIKAYPPEQYNGIVVLRPGPQDKPTVLTLVTRLVGALRQRVPERELWIVEPGRIRFR